MVNPRGASVDVVDMLTNVDAKCLLIYCEHMAVGIERVTALARTESMQPEILWCVTLTAISTALWCRGKRLGIPS